MENKLEKGVINDGISEKLSTFYKFLMWNSRFLAVKLSTQKKHTSHGTLGFLITMGSYGNLDFSKTFTAVTSLYRNSMCKMCMSCQFMQGQLRQTDQNSHLSSYMIVKLSVFPWLTVVICSWKTNKNGIHIMTQVRERKWRREEKVTEGAPDIWAYFFSFYILPISYDVFPTALWPQISQVREGVGEVLQV